MSREQLRSAAAAEVDRWEQALADELIRVFDRQERVVLTRLQGTKARKHTRHWEPPGDRPLEVKGIIDKARWLLDAVGSSRPVVTRMFESIYGRVAKQLDEGASSDPGDDRMGKVIDRTLELIQLGAQGAQDEVEALIEREEAAGTPMPQIVQKVRDLYADRKPSWAARIATISAVGTINHAGLMAAGDNHSSAKQWLSRRDTKVRDTHEQADGQVRLLDERFRLGGPKTKNPRSLLLFPGDPSPSVPLNEIMNCRCTLLFSPPRPRAQAKALEPVTGGRRKVEDFEDELVDEVPDETATAVAEGEATGRYVRTAAGADRFGQAIGDEIVRDSDDGVAYGRGTGRRKAPTTVAGYARMFDAVPVEQWGGGDVAISHKMPDGRRVWLYGDTVSKNNGFMHSTALVQTGGTLRASRGGKQLLPNAGKDPADPSRNVIYWPDGVRQGPTKDTLIVSAMEMSVGKANAFDFRHTREGTSREAVVKVSASGDLTFQRWKGYAPTPKVGNPHLANDFVTEGPHSFSYGTVVHDIKLADGSYLTSRSRNYDDGFEAHMSGGQLRYRDWAPTYGSTTTAPERKEAGMELETKDRVRTPAGVQHYGLPIGALIPPGSPRINLPRVNGARPELAGDDPRVRAMIAKHDPQLTLDPDATDVLVLRDRKDRVSAYVVWHTDGPDRGKVEKVSVHPSLRGKRIGDQMVAVAQGVDPAVVPPARQSRSSAPTPVPAVVPAPGVAAPRAARGQIADHSRPGDTPGTSGDFDADAARIDRLQKAYLRDKVDTMSLHSRGGRFSAARAKQQQEVIDHFLGQPGVKSDRKLLVLGGLPGAGKTTTINSPEGQAALGIDLSEYVTVNADEVKAEMVARGMVPDYPGLSADEAATLYHTESFEVAHALMRQAAKQGKNFAYDTSLKSTGQLGFATAASGRNAPPPYETTVLFVDVPIDVAKQRARDRYLAGGRYMPLGLIDGMKAHSSRRSSRPAENFDSVKGQAAVWAVFDNAGAAPVLTGQGGKGRRRAPAPATAAVAAPVAPAPVAAPVAVPAAASAVPAAPAGASVYQNRSGKVIHVLPDGSVVAYKPDGKVSRTTADAAKLAAGYGDWSLVSGSGSVPAAVPSAAAVSTPAQPIVAPNLSTPVSAPMSRPAALPAALPDPPAGSRVFVHPQGKHIYLLPDGSLAVYKPDGKRATSSATAAKLLAGYGGWSELGANTGTPLAATPAPAAPSTAAAPAIVAAPSAPLQVSAGAPAPSGSLPVTPMDFNEAPLADVPKYIADPDYVFQQKVDGIRGVLVIEPGRQPWFASKKGDRLVSSTAAQVTTPMLANLPATPAGAPAYRVEGEILNGKFHVFDMVIVGQESTDYDTRKTMADAWVEAVAPGLPQVTTLPTARTAAEKQALWDKVLASGAEGVMMKRRDAGYQGGQRVSHTLKAKITATADVVVLERNRGGKDNAVFGMLVNGRMTEIGTVSTGGKDKALGAIAVGEVLELEYLWASPGGTLTQPRIVRKRKDKTPNDATDVSQLRFVDKTVLALAAKHARLQLEAQIMRSTDAVRT